MQTDLLEKLCGLFAPSGCEDEVRDAVERELTGVADTLEKDKCGNLIATVKGASQMRLMLSAHMDEVGFMITRIDDEGYLKFSPLGGILPVVLCGRRVTVLGKNGKINGVITSKPIHLRSREEREKVTPADKMYIDIGAADKADAEKYVSPGDFATFDAEARRFGEDGKMLCAKAIDDRFGCAVLCEVIKRLKAEKIIPYYNLYFAFTVKEELSYSGAIPAAYKIAPDGAIVLEATAISDTADTKAHLRVADCGSGGVISIYDNGTVYDRDFVDFAFETAKKHKIKCQLKRYISGGNDAAHIHKTRAGVKTLAVSIPCRYLHTASNVIVTEDYYSILDLIYNMVCDMEASK